jgi:hypothetical protein
METLIGNPRLLIDHIRTQLVQQVDNKHFLTHRGKNETDAAAVLFLLGMHRPAPPPLAGPEPCLIFTQRSRHVCQPGDLCFPGGGVSPYLDRLLAGFLKLPGFPLFRRSFSVGRGADTPRRGEVSGNESSGKL